MKKIQKVIIAAVFLPAFIAAQIPQIGTAAWAAQHNHTQRLVGPVVTPQNGNDTLNNIYSNTACGLNYCMSSQRLGQRFVPIGIAQPAPLTVAMPACATVLKAYLYTEALGVAPSITATITDPSTTTTNFPMTDIGNSIDVCWGMNGTHVWRADVTSCITGPGIYSLSGLPVSTNTATVDVEGATLIVIYSDPSANWTGTLVMDDGCHTVASGPMSHTMMNVNACANSTSGTAFCLVGDMQFNTYTVIMNGVTVPTPQFNWWNEISTVTNVTNGQATCNYSLNDNGGDCYTLAVAGLYFKTTCSSCTPVATNLSLSTSSIPDNCNGNGSASVNVTGGSGNYTYLWLPGGQTTSTATNLAAGNYSVFVQDGSDCASASVTVSYTGAVLTMSSVGVTCSSAGSATVNVSGGTGPFTYNWSPSGGTNATANGLISGNYYVAVTDVGSGCMNTDSVFVANNSSFSAVVSAAPDTCNGNNGAASAFPNGGTAPYTYLWQPGGQTTQNISGLPVGSYTVTVTDASGCSYTGTTSVTAFALWVYAGTLGYFYCGDTIQLSAYSNDPNATYSWSPSSSLNNPNIYDPLSNTGMNITYTVTASNACMTAQDTFQVILDTLNYYNEQICFVSVDTALDKNVVIWERWGSPLNGYYNIYKENPITGQYALLASQPISQFTTYTDMASTPQLNADRYVITTVNPCGQESDTSYHHRTIFLQTTPDGTGGFDLAWTAYEGLPVTQYNIYRGTSISTLSLLTTVTSTTIYNDPAPPAGVNYYLVEAVHPFGGCAPSRTINSSYQPLDYSNALSNINTANPNGIAQDNLLQNSFSIAPNPNDGNFQLNIQVLISGKIEVKVFDAIGQIAYEKTENAGAGIFTEKMDLSSLAKGVYMVQVKTEKGTAVKRLVIE
ncbi:MAG: T9SS type A sorting domain-containing protein [Bacteroidetes bacterium]|nr:T9SS type A sorting domain-containing protein [Bacteroidota bacterium]